MPALRYWFRRVVFPAIVFGAVIAAHITYRGLFPERDPAQDRWASPVAAADSSWVDTYIRTEAYWNGIAYAIPLAFAAVMFRRYREHLVCSDRTLAIGGVGISGAMSVVACFLVGCCGSPMLGVYLGLFGAAFQPFARPLSAVLSALSVLAAWLWMRRREVRLTRQGEESPPSAECACAPECTIAMNGNSASVEAETVTP